MSARLPVLAGALLVAVLVPRAGAAAEMTASCTNVIASLPATIATSGTWCLSANLTTSLSSGAAIDIDSDDVVLDCNNFRIDGSSAPGTTAVGIRAEGRRNIVVRNCMVRGFYYGVYFDSLEVPANGRHVVEDNTFNLSRSVGIYVDGDGSAIRRNRVTNTLAPAPFGSAFAIQAYGTVDIVDNIVRRVEAHNAAAAGILVNESSGASVRGNRVGTLAIASGTGPIVGIRMQNNSSRVVLRGNVLSGDGIATSVGIGCDNPSHVVKSNSIAGFDTALECTDNGNLIKP